MKLTLHQNIYETQMFYLNVSYCKKLNEYNY